MLILFIVGLILSILGFLVSQGTQIPGFMNLVANQYIICKEATAKLLSTKELLPNDHGFRELEKLLLNTLTKGNEEENEKLWNRLPSLTEKELNQESIVRIEMRGVAPVDPKRWHLKFKVARVIFSSGGKTQFTFEELEKRIDEMIKARLFHWAWIIFSFGVIVEIFSFVFSFKLYKT